MKIAILTPTLNDGDGVGNDILGMTRVLRSGGHTVALVADAARVAEEVQPLTGFRAAGYDRVIYHHSIRCDAGVRAVQEAGRQGIVKYHNITPPRFFMGVHADAAAGATGGLVQAAELAAGPCQMWVDSAFNGEELQRAVPGCRWAELPPFHQADLLRNTLPDARSLQGFDGWGPTIVAVGRVAPNKNLVLAVEAFAAFQQQNPTAQLLIVGEHIFPEYSARISNAIQIHGLEESVHRLGRVTVAQLKGLYLNADALLVTSEHEG
ncbi:MAG: glycosyltransferase, partial [Gemmataceae bacterium]